MLDLFPLEVTKAVRAVTSKWQDEALVSSRFSPKTKNKICFVGKIRLSFLKKCVMKNVSERVSEILDVKIF